MMLQIKRWLAPPVFPDDEPKTRRAILLNSALLTSMVLALCLIAGNLAGGTVPAVVTGLDIGLVAMCLALRRWAYQGRVGLASGALLAVGLVGITLAVTMLGTIRTPSTALYMLLVIFAGLLFDLGGMIAMTVLCSLAIAGLIVAENTGWLPRPDYAVTITQWFTYTVLFVWVGSSTLSSLQSTRRALARADKEIAGRKQTEEALHLLSDTQRQIAQQENLADIFRLVGQKIHELIGDGYVAITILDEQEQAMKVIGLYGFGSLPESLVRMLKVNPSKMVFDLKDMTADELRLFRSGNLEKFEKGLYHLSVRKVPERVCEVAEKH